MWSDHLLKTNLPINQSAQFGKFSILSKIFAYNFDTFFVPLWIMFICLCFPAVSFEFEILSNLPFNKFKFLSFQNSNVLNYRYVSLAFQSENSPCSNCLKLFGNNNIGQKY